MDLERQRRVLHNAAVIQARDQEEHARIAASAPAKDDKPSPSIPQDVHTRKQDPSLCSSDGLERPPPSSEIHDAKQALRPSHGLSSELPLVGKDRDWQPEAWTPQTTRRWKS
jgi:NADH dehydrogenase [ubiquinone] 1 alpha subcomplex assembly factor 2